MMVVMFILSLVLAAAAPIITKRAIQDGGMESKVKALITTVNNMITAIDGINTTINDINTAMNVLKTRIDALESGSGTAKCDTSQVKVLDLCVAKTDISASSTWDNANTLCWAQGLRLPTQEELKIMYYYKNTIGNFSAAIYWSATLQGYNVDYDIAWNQNFSSGAQYCNAFYNPNRVRCVRSLY
jgi:competence protein ComGC